MEMVEGAILWNGTAIPWIGLGVLAMDPSSTQRAVLQALEIGYRHFDTASAYGNEADVGMAIRSSGLPRSEIFVTTKVWNVNQGYDPTIRAFEASLAKLGLPYVDLYLAHWPFEGDMEGTWSALERVYDEGRARAIGVSNFLPHHLERLFAKATIAPMVNQVEFHPLLQQDALLQFCSSHEIQLVAWKPIMRGEVNRIPQLQRIGRAYSKSPVQVVLRWMYQKHVVAIPKTVRQHRMRLNSDIFDFNLAREDVDLINSLNEERRFGQHPDTFRPPSTSMPRMPWM